MKNTTSFKVLNRFLFGAGILAMVLPVISSAATFAYVNQAGDVTTVNAHTATSALFIAPNIDTHSGVMELNTNGSDNGVIGNHVF